MKNKSRIQGSSYKYKIKALLQSSGSLYQMSEAQEINSSSIFDNNDLYFCEMDAPLQERTPTAESGFCINKGKQTWEWG